MQELKFKLLHRVFVELDIDDLVRDGVFKNATGCYRATWRPASLPYIVKGRWVHHVVARVCRTDAIVPDRCCPRPPFSI